MKSRIASRVMPAAFLLLVLLVLMPVPVLAADEPTIMATVSSTQPLVGEPVTVSGYANGGNLTPGVQIWVFAGSYVNVTTVPVDATGAFSATYQTRDLPAATYYVLVEGAGNDGSFDVVLTNTSGYASDVVNPKTGATVMTFSGTGSVHDMEAMETLSSALNQAGYDDPYAKISFKLIGPDRETTAVVTTTAAPVQTTTAKSPLPVAVCVAALAFAGLAVTLARRN